MKDYGIGNNIIRILSQYWEFQQSTVRKGKYFGKQFHPTRGVTQGDIVSPTLFNLIVDFVLKSIHKGLNTSVKTIALFYADDGAISGSDPFEVQTITIK